MAHIIQNRLQIKPDNSKGDASSLEDRVAHVRAFIEGGVAAKGKSIAIDFRRILEIPDGLMGDLPDSHPTTQALLHEVLDEDMTTTNVAKLLTDLEGFRKLDYDKQLRTLYAEIAYRMNIRAYGVGTGLEWCRKYWGTIQNAWNTPDDRDTLDTIYFQTWETPVIEAIEALSHKFPTVTFKLEYASANGADVGVVSHIAGGNVMREYPVPPGRFDLVSDLWPGLRTAVLDKDPEG